jgi:hypothetical protein
MCLQGAHGSASLAAGENQTSRLMEGPEESSG